MENASRALLIAGSVLITLMLVAVFVYAFNSGQDFNYSITSTTEDVAVASFNSKFSIYETDLNYDINNNDNYLTASTELNTIADVVTAVNHAVSVNDENNDGYKYVSDSDTGNTGRRKVETENAVEVVIDLQEEPYTDEIRTYDYLGIEPHTNVKSGYVYPITWYDDNRSLRISSIETDENNTYGVLCNDLLSKYTTSKLITVNSKNYTIYEYYFTGKLGWDNSTGKINSIIFTLVKDENFTDH